MKDYCPPTHTRAHRQNKGLTFSEWDIFLFLPVIESR